MRNVVIAVAQQILRLYPDLDSYRRDLERFFRLAETKHARLIVFPPRTGLMIIPPLVGGFRSGLLKKADLERKRASSWWTRARSGVMRSTAKFLGADITRELERVLREDPETIWENYVEIFSALAYEYKTTVVAGSGYFRDINDGVLRHIATVFGPDGDIIGQQAQVMLGDEVPHLVAPGQGWQALPTPVGRLGILFEEEVMYPEVGRVFAYQGVEGLIALGSTREEMVVRLYHDGLKARVTDNQVFGALAFVVGTDPFQSEEKPPYRGRSVIMAPHGLTARGNGVLVEAGSSTAEVLVTARWDFEALHMYWRSTPLRLRQRLPVKEAASILAPLYSQGMTLEDAMRALPGRGPRALPQQGEVEDRVSPPPSDEEEPPQGKEIATREASVAEPSEEEGRLAVEVDHVEEHSPVAGTLSEQAQEEGPSMSLPQEEPGAEEETSPPMGEDEEPAVGGLEIARTGYVFEEEEEEIAEARSDVEEGAVSPEESASTDGVAETPETALETPTPTDRSEATSAVVEVNAPGEGEDIMVGGADHIEAGGLEHRAEEQTAVRGDTPASSETSAWESAPKVAEQAEETTIPEELWAAIKTELERAAATLRSLREPEPEEDEGLREEKHHADRELPPAREGWFHRFLRQTSLSDTGNDDIF